MAIKRVDISSEIQDWKSAVYGEEVRSANVSALTKLQTQINDACDGIELVEGNATDTLAKAQSASDTANQASKDANTAIDTANNAVTQAQGYANAAASSATAAAEKVTECSAYANDAQAAKTDAQAAKAAAETARDEAREAVPADYTELINRLDNLFEVVHTW